MYISLLENSKDAKEQRQQQGRFVFCLILGQIFQVKNAAVYSHRNPYCPWRNIDMFAYLRRFIKRVWTTRASC